MPAALTYAPRDGAFGEIGEEMRTTLYYAGDAPDGAAKLALPRAVGRLRWSNRRLTELVRHRRPRKTRPWRLRCRMCAPTSRRGRRARMRRCRRARRVPRARSCARIGRYVGPSEEAREAVIRRLLRPYEGPAKGGGEADQPPRTTRTGSMRRLKKPPGRLAAALGFRRCESARTWPPPRARVRGAGARVARRRRCADAALAFGSCSHTQLVVPQRGSVRNAYGAIRSRRPAVGSIALAVQRVPASAPRVGVIVLLAGGPGQPALPAVRGVPRAARARNGAARL